MIDIFSKEKRSKLMGEIPSEGTRLEEMIQKFLFSKGFRYRKNDKRLPGTPDIVLPKYKTTIFINGCFWHGHKNCKAAKLPETNSDFWKNKIASNVKRDRQNVKKLKDADWTVIVIWQCEINNKKLRNDRLNQLVKQIIRNWDTEINELSFL